MVSENSMYSPSSIADVKAVHDPQGYSHGKGDCNGVIIEPEILCVPDSAQKSKDCKPRSLKMQQW
jgi:hypothetical protein